MGALGMPAEPLMDLILQRALEAGLGRKAFLLARFGEPGERNWWRWVGGQTVRRDCADQICNTLGVHPAEVWPEWDTPPRIPGRPMSDRRADHTWKIDGACRGEDPDIFFPTRGEDLEQARAICSMCPVFDQCHEAGLYERHGVWAGLSERERKRLRKQLGIRLIDDDPLDDQHDTDGLEVA